MIKAIRGTRDLLPPDTVLWNFVENTVRDVFAAYNFHEIRTPIMEGTELFARGVGEETDIVIKEMFTWDDKARAASEKGQSLTLRPENTAGVVRAYIEHDLGKRGLNKLYYIGPQFRRERPAKGRFRQFYQIGAEVIGPASSGSESPVRDAELLEMLATLLDRVGITEWRLELNSVGCPMGQDVQHFCEKCGFLRLDLAQKYAAKHKAFDKTGEVEKDYRFLWVSDFPMFEWDQQEKRWNPAHHPFTTLHEEDFAKLDANIDTVLDPKSPLGEIRALAYDVVLNGTELGSGSIRIHRQDVQKKIFQALGMSNAEAKARFGFFLEALEYGTPPHGGIALGLDRIVMILAGAESLREVIPFPKTARAVDLMVDAPSPASEKQLKELGLVIRKPTD